MSGGEGLGADPLTALRSQPSGPVKIDFSDGESVLAADITFLEDEGLVWYRLLRSNRPKKYESFDGERCQVPFRPRGCGWYFPIHTAQPPSTPRAPNRTAYFVY